MIFPLPFLPLLLFLFHAVVIVGETEPTPLITVHLVPHSHIDAGWQISLDEYQFSEVDTIFDNVLLQLEQDPSRTFSIGEMAFFSSWFQRQPSSIQTRFSRLVATHQVEFVNGGWVQHDEATPLYHDMLDQTTRGHHFLMKEFGTTPTITWQLDPFGHSSTSALLFRADFSALFIARASFDERAARLDNRTLEFLWQPSPHTAPLFTSLLYGTGDASGSFYHSFFNFEQTSAQTRNYVQDDARFSGYNAPVWIQRALVAARLQNSHSQHPHQIWLMGDDFTYQHASNWYRHLGKLIALVNANTSVHNVRLQFSTPSRYLAAIGTSSSPLRSQADFFPLAESPAAVWSGYFSSRPSLKLQHRVSSALLRVSRQIEYTHLILFHELPSPVDCLVPSPRIGQGATDDLEGSVALVTHHDALTGTARQSVTNDYAWRLALGAARARNASLAQLARIAGFTDSGFACDCHSSVMDCLNTSTCSFAHTHYEFTVLIWNPLAVPRTVLIELPVPRWNYIVRDLTLDRLIPAQFVPLDPLTQSLPLLYINKHGLSPWHLSAQTAALTNPARFRGIFSASLPALGYSTFRFSPLVTAAEDDAVAAATAATTTVLSNARCQVHFDPTTNAITSLRNLVSNLETPLSLHWVIYQPETNVSTQRSGAYIFRPTFIKQILSTPLSSELVSNGPLVWEVRQKMAPWAWHTVRLRQDQCAVELEWTAGPLPIDSEVVLRYSTQVKSGDAFETDANFYNVVPRKRSRAGVAASYFPVTAFISIADSKSMFTVVTPNVAQGGSSLAPGQVELMVHRRLSMDDSRGVEEPLNETMCGCGDAGAAPGTTTRGTQCDCQGLVVRATHLLHLDTPPRGKLARRQLFLHGANPGLPLFFESAPTRPSLSLLTAPLPSNVDLVTLNANYHPRTRTVMLRLANMYSATELNTTANVAVSLKGLSSALQPTTLTGTRALPGPPVSSSNVPLDPLQVRTFTAAIVAYTQALV